MEKLIKSTIMTNAKQMSQGEWSYEIDENRIFNLDETPQSINFENNGSSPRLLLPKRRGMSKVD